MPRKTQADADEPTSPWTSKSFIASAVVIALIAILGVGLVLTGPAGEPAPTAEAGPAPSSAPSAAAAEAGGSVCNLPSDAEMLTAAPTGTQWELVGSLAAPSNPEKHGPGRSENGWRTCYARSPTGALYAAVGFWAAGTAQPGAAALEKLAADTPVRAAAIADARAQGETERVDDASRFQVAGFRFLSYTADSASVDLLMRLTDGAFVNIPTTMKWEAGDWKYVVPPDGNPGGGQVRDIDRYVTWGGA